MRDKLDKLEASIKAAHRKKMIDMILLALVMGACAGIAAYVVLDRMKGIYNVG